MDELIKQLTPELLNIAKILLIAFAGYLGVKLNLLLVDTQKRMIVESSVKYVEQVAKTLGSVEKFAMAKGRVIELLGRFKIKISDIELQTLIESAVLSFNEHYKAK